LAKPPDGYATNLASHGSDEFGHAVMQRSDGPPQLASDACGQPRNDKFGRISGRRSSEINEISCAVSVLAWHSLGASLERLKIEARKNRTAGQGHGHESVNGQLLAGTHSGSYL